MINGIFNDTLSFNAVRPLIFGVSAADEQVEPEDGSWETLEAAPFAVAQGEDVGVHADDEEVVQDADGEAARPPRPLPEPRLPHPRVVRQHNLTHWPYAAWCRWCLQARRNADPHFQRKGRDDRDRPLFVLDYCFIRNSTDQELVTLLVGKMHPFQAVFACVVDVK